MFGVTLRTQDNRLIILIQRKRLARNALTLMAHNRSRLISDLDSGPKSVPSDRTNAGRGRKDTLAHTIAIKTKQKYKHPPLLSPGELGVRPSMHKTRVLETIKENLVKGVGG